MNNEGHLILNIIFLVIISFIVYKLFNFYIFDLNLFHLFITVFVFSNISDIDNSKARISVMFIIFYIMLGFYGIIKIMNVEILKGICMVIVATSLGLYHSHVSEDSYKHRKFPHTLTFGLLASIILLYFTSFIISAIGFFCFVSHIIFDNHFLQAIKNDIIFWKNIFGYESRENLDFPKSCDEIRKHSKTDIGKERIG